MEITESRYYLADDLTARACELVSAIAAHHEVAAVAGVPRSGMLAAAAAAVHLGVPLYEARLDGLRPLAGGRRFEGRTFKGRCVVLEDSVNTAGRFLAVREALGESHLYASVFCVDPERARLDAWHTHIPLPHWFDWWMFQSHWLTSRRIGLDFDGILCRDCPRGDDDDGPRYARFLAEVLPIRYARPHGAYATISGRLEKYRAATLAWCARHHQMPGKLILGPWKDNAARAGNIAAHKAAQIKAYELGGFIESDDRQARQIAAAVSVPVACPATRKVYQRA